MYLMYKIELKTQKPVKSDLICVKSIKSDRVYELIGSTKMLCKMSGFFGFV